MSQGNSQPRAHDTFVWCCPACRTRLLQPSEDLFLCRNDKLSYDRKGLIWDFLTDRRRADFEQFEREYLWIRHAEGRGSAESDYYRRLPYSQEPGEIGRQWRIRARSFECLMSDCLPGLSSRSGDVLRILDLGAGNGWLSYRLSRLGHQVAAVDVLEDELDGLGACRHYRQTFTLVRAEFDALPFEDGQFDVAIFNASLHYSSDYSRTLSSAFRALHAGGSLIVMDTPLYRDASSGSRMVEERRDSFQHRFGITSDSIAYENFLTFERLDQLSGQLGVRWEFIWPNYGWKWRIRPLVALVRRRREPATFGLIVGRPAGAR